MIHAWRRGRREGGRRKERVEERGKTENRRPKYSHVPADRRRRRKDGGGGEEREEMATLT